jgi:hypothetical protein
VSQHTLTVILLGHALAAAGHHEQALARASEGLDLARCRKEPGYEAYTLWLLGETLGRLGGDDARAERSYEEALRLATGLGMRPLAAHCHHGLGALARRRGDLDAGHAHWTIARTMYGELQMARWLEQVEAELARADL